MRIISGTLRGRKLMDLSGNDIRPTSDRVREAVFNILGQKVRDARVLDLFAGTGALGLESLSRGAAHTLFVDTAPSSCAIIQKNIDRCNIGPQATIIQHDIMGLPLPQILRENPFDLIFMDPPYGLGYVGATLEKAGFIDLLATDGIIIAEQSFKTPLTKAINGLDIYRQKKYSKSFISFLRKRSN